MQKLTVGFVPMAPNFSGCLFSHYLRQMQAQLSREEPELVFSMLEAVDNQDKLPTSHFQLLI